MNNQEQIKFDIESKEQEPKPLATIFVFRHGDTQYKEEFTNPDVEDDLTEKGKGQIQNLAEQLEKKVDKGEKVYIMMSPRTRAQDSAKIIKETFEQTGHEVVNLGGGRQSLSNVKILDKEGHDVYKKQNNKEQYLADMADVLERIKQESDYYIKSRLGALENPITENISEYRKKVETFLKRIIEIARQRAGDNEKLIIATHGEWLDTILESYFDRKIEKAEDSADRGEAIEIRVLFDKVKFNFRGEVITVNI